MTFIFVIEKMLTGCMSPVKFFLGSKLKNNNIEAYSSEFSNLKLRVLRDTHVAMQYLIYVEK